MFLGPSCSEGFHNVGFSQNLDACLTERGWDQAHTLGRHMYSQQPTAGVQLVVVSPLVRALETAAGVFGIEPSKCEYDPPTVLMAGQEAERNVRTAHGAVALRPGVKFVAVELCRERLGKRRAANGCRGRVGGQEGPHALSWWLVGSVAGWLVGWLGGWLVKVQPPGRARVC